jgi:hypothetical protein
MFMKAEDLTPIVISKTKKVLIPMLLLLLMLSVDKAGATLYCNRTYTELTQDPGRPYNAVGYLNNGCTAFLIDANHIVAAAHCFVDEKTKDWQTSLRFYPNFHPDRVAADAHHVPRGDVTRAVVGSRVGFSGTAAEDWGIARIDNWQDTDELDLTPLTLASAVPPVGTALVNPAYTRHHFPYNDNDAVTWDNMEWDSTNCGWVGSHHGIWAITMRPAPFVDGVNRDMVACNSRWGAGMIHADCSLTKVVGHVIVHNCDTVGGSSGSPIMHRTAGGCTPGRWSVIGVGSGGGAADFSQLTPVCTIDTPVRRDNVGASVEQFRLAPRFASNVAVHRRSDNQMATTVFAVDSDLNQVVYRARAGGIPTYNGDFTFWESLGRPSPGTPFGRGKQLTRIAACSADTNARPQVFVVADNSEIYTRLVQADGGWSQWSSFGIPNSADGVIDIDAAHDASGRCQLFMVAENGSAFTRTKNSDGSWQTWSTVASGSFKRITALKYQGVVWATMVDSAGQIWRTSFEMTGWAIPTKLDNPPGVGAWRDIDMTWDELARGFMLAIPEGGGNRLWFVPMYGSDAWKWFYFDTHLWAPSVTNPVDSPDMLSITASRWMEDPPGTTSPVIFATDDNGNIYLIEYARVGNPGWVLDWKSFYHENIPYN